MMKYLTALIVFEFAILNVNAQMSDSYLWKGPVEKAGFKGKPVIDFEAIDRWVDLGPNQVTISNDGAYFQYTLYNQPYKSHTLVLQSTQGSWKHEFAGLEKGFFSGNSSQYIIAMGDSLCILLLGSDSINYIKNVASYKELDSGKDHWLVYQLKDSGLTLVLQNLYTGKEQHFDRVISYSFDNSRGWLIIQYKNKDMWMYNLTTNKQIKLSDVTSYSFNEKQATVLIAKTGSATTENLMWVQLAGGSSRVIWKAKDNMQIGSFATDLTGTQVVFTTKQPTSQSYSVWYCKEDWLNAEMKANNKSLGLEVGMFIEKAVSFSPDGQFIKINLIKNHDEQKKQPGAVQLDIWNYKDTFLQSAQLLAEDVKMNLIPKPYVATISVKDNRVVRITNDYERVGLFKGGVGLVTKLIQTDRFWEKYYEQDSVWIVNLSNGNRIFLKNGLSINYTHFFCDKYFVYFDEKNAQYISYDTQTGKLANISNGVLVFLGSENKYDPYLNVNNLKTGYAGQLENDQSILVYDKYDIWKLDLRGQKPPVNITRGYGRRNEIILRLTDGQWNDPSKIPEKKSFIVTGFNTRTRDNGFFRISLHGEADPELLYMGPYILDFNIRGLPNNGDLPGGLMSPVKARDANVWIVSRQSATEAPNYYMTKDLKTFSPLTNLQPQKKYNWVTAEIVSFRQLDGTISQGILYKPENFDSTKRYPVLFNYYWQFTQGLHGYLPPFYTTNGYINIPWFVSRGYLVVTPDIYFTVNRHSGASALNTVEGAAQYMSTLKFVDSKRMGIAGHSRAGGYTNYILTHSNSFAAALEGAGISDWVSSALQLIWDIGKSRLDRYELEGLRGGDIWSGKINHSESPIMQVDKISSPLLIMHNKLDGAVPWEQAVELFTAMRRLNKKVWMLQYDGQGHSLILPENYLDFTIRITQFYDYYLKGAPPPLWMTTGVPAARKGIDTGLEFDLKTDATP